MCKNCLKCCSTTRNLRSPSPCPLNKYVEQHFFAFLGVYSTAPFLSSPAGEEWMLIEMHVLYRTSPFFPHRVGIFLCIPSVPKGSESELGCRHRASDLPFPLNRKVSGEPEGVELLAEGDSDYQWWSQEQNPLFLVSAQRALPWTTLPAMLQLTWRYLEFLTVLLSSPSPSKNKCQLGKKPALDKPSLMASNSRSLGFAGWQT